MHLSVDSYTVNSLFNELRREIENDLLYLESLKSEIGKAWKMCINSKDCFRGVDQYKVFQLGDQN